ncbi:hypothetical protein H1V43_24255 [Streptomyces sp. PSKA54]|uniref:PPE domain-containing protein n=1 Tax=Streptomyces himalayensis subsp. aureolus TaxID=2758039 RepID=A0A7W2D462_9ACTN|nr:hypothetical protein [Streptomyces himalayensis]MBA4864410.1 hypothetical protein [Streptomyces himalayensis subsp. aureolus]
MGQESIGGSVEYVDANQCFAEKHSTPFGLDYDMDQMKAMVQNADPGAVEKVAEGWAALSKELVGSGGIKETFEAAVKHVTAHWEGESADLFAQRAQVISQKITDSAKYADNTSQSLRGAAVVLADIKPKVLAMEKPNWLEDKGDFLGDLGDRDAKGADDALKSGAGSQAALDNNEGSLSAGREAQLKMAAQMEILGAAYNSRAKELGSWTRVRDEPPPENYPGEPGGFPPAAVVVPTAVAPRSPKAATSGTARGGQAGTISQSKPVAPPSGITGGAHKPTAPQPQVSTAIDGVSGGRTGAPTVGGVGTVGGGSAGGGAVGGGAGLVGGVPGGAAGAGGARGAMAGRGGMAGRAGTGAGTGAGAAKGGAARAGGLARQSGGVVGGTPKSGTGAGRGTAGGSGLHRSRGAAGGAGASRKGGMVGVPGARTGKPKDQEGREGERPDYLVEDEETWTPQTNAAPRVIE